MNRVSMMKALVLILRAQDKNWQGDRIENTECACKRIANTMPNAALDLMQDLENNGQTWSGTLGISPERVHWFATTFREALAHRDFSATIG